MRMSERACDDVGYAIELIATVDELLDDVLTEMGVPERDRGSVVELDVEEMQVTSVRELRRVRGLLDQAGATLRLLLERELG